MPFKFNCAIGFSISNHQDKSPIQAQYGDGEVLLNAQHFYVLSEDSREEEKRPRAKEAVGSWIEKATYV